PFLSSSASISASGVPTLADSTSSSGSYSVTPERPDRSSVRSVWLGRPMARLLPEPAISNALPPPSAQRTASSTSLASRGLSRSVMAGRSRSKNGALSPAYIPAIPIHLATPRQHYRDHRHEPGDDSEVKMMSPETRYASPLKPRNVRERQLAAGDVHAAEFGAA